MKASFLLLTAGWMCAGPAFAAFSYPGCADLAASDFKEVVLVSRGTTVPAALAVDTSLLEPVSLFVKPDGKVYWTERTNRGSGSTQTAIGKVKVFDPTNNTVTTVLTHSITGKVTNPVSGLFNEYGMRSVTLHPDFGTNRWAFVFYSPEKVINNGRDVDSMRVSRFTVLPNGMFDTTSEKIILDMPWSLGGCCHQGGAMDWDNHGNLYVTTGNDREFPDGFASMVTTLFGSTGENKDRATQDNQAGPSNTMDWRGKLLRIHPDNSAKGYSVPAGNLRQRFYELGGSWVAGQDTAKILPEIYSFGYRNPYTMSVDTVSGWVMIASSAPDANSYDATRGSPGTEQWHIDTKPQFDGWPYFTGPARPGPSVKDSAAYAMINPATNQYTLPVQSRDTVYNNSPNNTGVTHLLPVTSPVMTESRQAGWNGGLNAAFGQGGAGAATAGPLYRYNAFPQNPKKWPPHLDGKWIIAESARFLVMAATPNGTGTAVTDLQTLPGSAEVMKPTGPSGGYGVADMKFGPEGALYITHYAAARYNATATTRISRVEYQGACTPAATSVNRVRSRTPEPSEGMFYVNLGGRLEWPKGMHFAEIFDLQGRRAWAAGRKGSEDFARLPASLKHGVLRVQFKP